MAKVLTRKRNSTIQLIDAGKILLERSKKQVTRAGVRILQCKLVLAKRGKGQL